MTTISEVAGIDSQSATRLRRAGIKTAEAFMERIKDPSEMRWLSEQTGIDRDTLADIATAVDLLTLEGLGSRYCALLKSAGINSVDDLGRRSAAEILEELEAANHRIRTVKRLPNLEYVQSWVMQARKMEKGEAGGRPGG